MTDENKLRKYSRIGFALSCIFNSIIHLMGVFYLTMVKFFPSLCKNLLTSADYSATGFPPFDILILPFVFLFDLYLLAIYGVFPLLFGGAGLLRNVYTKLFRLKNAEIADIYKQVKKLNDIDFVFILLNIALSFGFSASGIYPKIHTYVNIFIAVVLCILMFVKPRIQKPEQNENTEDA